MRKSEGQLTAINLLACSRSIAPLLEADERETLGPAGIPIFSEEDSGHAAEALEDLAQVVLFGELGDLKEIISVPGQILQKAARSQKVCPEMKRLTFVTLSVARSSLSYLPPILSPVAAPPFLKCGGTYPPPPPPKPPSFDGASPSPVSAPLAAPPSAPSTPSGARVSLKGHFIV